MTVFVTEPALRGNRMLKPQPVAERYAEDADMLHHLIGMHPEAIYYTDDTSPWDQQPKVGRMLVSPLLGHGATDIDCSTVFLQTTTASFKISAKRDGSIKITSENGDGLVIDPVMSNVIVVGTRE